LNRTEKEAFVSEFREKLDRAKLAVVASFIGLDVEKVNALRSKLRAADVEMKVVKNRLAILAGEGKPLSKLDKLFAGPSAVMLSFGEDPVAPAKILRDFAKDNPKLEIKGGILDGQAMTAADVDTLSRLPDKATLRAQLLGVLQAPARNMVSLLAQVPRGLLNVLNAKAEQNQAT
jgi:large subunit ribosomal protein L10